MNKIVFTVAVLKDNPCNQLHFCADKANAFSGFQLNSCMEGSLADVLPVKQWDLWQDPMQAISAGTAHDLQKCPLEKCWLVWGTFVGKDSKSTFLWLFHETLIQFSKRKKFSPSVENKAHFYCS